MMLMAPRRKKNLLATGAMCLFWNTARGWQIFVSTCIFYHWVFASCRTLGGVRRKRSKERVRGKTRRMGKEWPESA